MPSFETGSYSTSIEYTVIPALLLVSYLHWGSEPNEYPNFSILAMNNFPGFGVLWMSKIYSFYVPSSRQVQVSSWCCFLWMEKHLELKKTIREFSVYCMIYPVR